MLTLYTLTLLAHAREATESVFVINPVLPSITILADGVVSLTEIEDFMNQYGMSIYVGINYTTIDGDRWLSWIIRQATRKSSHVSQLSRLPQNLVLKVKSSVWNTRGTTISTSRIPFQRVLQGVGTNWGVVWFESLLFDWGPIRHNGFYRVCRRIERTDHRRTTYVPSVHTGIGYVF